MFVQMSQPKKRSVSCAAVDVTGTESRCDNRCSWRRQLQSFNGRLNNVPLVCTITHRPVKLHKAIEKKE